MVQFCFIVKTPPCYASVWPHLSTLLSISAISLPSMGEKYIEIAHELKGNKKRKVLFLSLNEVAVFVLFCVFFFFAESHWPEDNLSPMRGNLLFKVLVLSVYLYFLSDSLSFFFKSRLNKELLVSGTNTFFLRCFKFTLIISQMRWSQLLLRSVIFVTNRI